MAVNGAALASVLTGSVFLYAGLKGKSVTQAVQYIIQGKNPADSPQVNPIADVPITDTSATDSTPSGGTPGNAAGALKYVGHAYLFGGAPGRDGKSPWDCSSFANWVVGHDQGLPIPGYAGGTYDGRVHGPATVGWLAWSGAQHIPASSAQPGDLIVWASHMGIYLGGGQMISALNPRLGTRVTTVKGGAPGGEGAGTYMRVKLTGTTQAIGTTTAAGRG